MVRRGELVLVMDNVQHCRVWEVELSVGDPEPCLIKLLMIYIPDIIVNWIW
jgi:hypothetical protein